VILHGFVVACFLGTALPQTSSTTVGPTGVTIGKAKVETFTSVSDENGSIAGAPDSNPNRLPLPTQGTSSTMVRTQLYVYSMELNNNGARPIKALTWDFIFNDTTSDAELLRRSFANVQQIDTGKHKAIKFTTQLSPPKTVTSEALKNANRLPFAVHAVIQCILFTDGSAWERPDSIGKCDRLRKWIEKRKESKAGLEDFPFNP